MTETLTLSSILIAQLWQVTLLAIIALVVVRTVAKNRPHLAIAIWLVVLAKCITPPIWSSPTGVFCWLSPSEHSEQVAQADAESLVKQSGDRIEQRKFVSPLQKAIANRNTRRSNPRFATNQTKVFIEHDFGSTANDQLATTGEWAPENVVDDSTNEANSISFAPILVAIWFVGAIAMLAVSAIRCWLCMRRLKRTSQRADRTIQLATNRIASKLKLRRKVIVFVTDSLIGPAVIGVFRPVIVLPRVIVETVPVRELEPILAHELTHIRRGDLWFGFFQLLAGSLWWFHPLVRVVNRMAVRDAERCCDEEVIGRFGFSTTEYARSLVNVLQCKQALVPAAAFPGVRPIDITTRRLERIMSLRNGCHKRAPIWCWLIALAASLVVLPGAAIGVIQQGKDSVPTTTEKSVESNKESSLNNKSPADPATDETMTVVEYEIGELLAKYGTEFELVAPMDRRRFASHIKSLSKWPVEPVEIPSKVLEAVRAAPELEVDFKAAPPAREWQPTAVEQRKRIAEERNSELIKKRADEHLKMMEAKLAKHFEWKNEGKTLAIKQTAEVHQRIKEALRICREHGFGQAMIELRFVTCDDELHELLNRKMKGQRVLNASGNLETINQAIKPLKQEESNGRIGRAVIEKEIPATYGTLDDEDMRTLMKAIQSDVDSNIMMAPKITMLTGQSAQCRIGTQRPFVVAMKDDKPVLRICEDGVTTSTRMLPLGNGFVRLELAAEVKKIADVLTFTYKDYETGKDVTVQVPHVENARIEAGVEMEFGKTLVLNGLLSPGSKNDQRLIVLATPRKIDENREVELEDAKSKPSPVKDAPIGVQPVQYNVAVNEEGVHSLREQRVDPKKLAKEPIIARTYPLGDLFDEMTPVIDATDSSPKKSFWIDQMDEFMKDTRLTFAPESWEESGGEGRMIFHEKTLSLVVFQGRSVHEALQEEFEDAREQMKKKAALRLIVIEPGTEAWRSMQAAGINSQKQKLSKIETFFVKQQIFESRQRRENSSQPALVNLIDGQGYRFSSQSAQLTEKYQGLFEHALVKAEPHLDDKLSFAMVYGDKAGVDTIVHSMYDMGDEPESPHADEDLTHKSMVVDEGESMLVHFSEDASDVENGVMLMIVAESVFPQGEAEAEMEGQVLPSPYYYEDGVQYFPATQSGPTPAPVQSPELIENEAGEIQEVPYVKGFIEFLPDSEPARQLKR